MFVSISIACSSVVKDSVEGWGEFIFNPSSLCISFCLAVAIFSA